MERISEKFHPEESTNPTSIRCGCGSIHPGGVHCGQPERDARLLEAVENPDIVYYGPHPCDLCGQGSIARGSVEQGFGDIRLDYPAEEIIYPNHNWKEHVCREPRHRNGCICADCSGGKLTADND